MEEAEDVFFLVKAGEDSKLRVGVQVHDISVPAVTA